MINLEKIHALLTIILIIKMIVYIIKENKINKELQELLIKKLISNY